MAITKSILGLIACITLLLLTISSVHSFSNDSLSDLTLKNNQQFTLDLKDDPEFLQDCISIENNDNNQCKFLSPMLMETLQNTNNSPDEYHLEADPDSYIGVKFTNPAQLRESMLRAGWDCPGGLCDAGYGFVKSFPRVRGDKTFPEALKNRQWGDSTVVDYGIGVASVTVGLPLIFLIIFCVGCSCFACWRGCCCNMCGGRIATKKYTTKRQLCLRIGIPIWALLVIFVLFLAIAANHGLSKGINNTVNGADMALGFVDTTIVALGNVTTPFHSRLVSLETVRAAFAELPSDLDDSKTCYAGQYNPEAYSPYDPSWLTETYREQIDPCISNPSDPYCQTPPTICETESSTPGSPCDPCSKNNLYWRKMHDLTAPKCTGFCSANAEAAYSFPNSPLCNPCNPRSPVADSSNSMCLPVDSVNHPCRAQWATDAWNDLNATPECERCNTNNIYYSTITPGIQKCTRPCSLSPATGYCDPCNLTAKAFSATSCPIVNNRYDPCVELQQNNPQYTAADCDVCNPYDLRYSPTNPNCASYWFNPEQRLPNEDKIINHLNLETRLTNVGTDVKGDTNYPLVNAVSNALQPAFSSVRAAATASDPATNWDNDATRTSNDMNIDSSAFQSNNFPQTTVQSYFDPAAEIYMTVSNVTALSQSVLIPGSYQISSLRGSNNALKTLTDPFMGKNWSEMITAFQSTTLSPQQCTSIRDQISPFIQNMLAVVDLNRASTNSSLPTDLDLFQTAYTSNDLQAKFGFIQSRKSRLAATRSTMNDAQITFAATQLITALNNVDFTILTSTQRNLGSISNLIEAYRTQIPTTPVATIYDSSSAITNSYNGFGTTSTNYATSFTTLSNDVKSASLTNVCLVTLVTQLDVGGTWITPVEDQAIFLVKQKDKLSALLTDFSTADSNHNYGANIEQVRSHIIDTIESVASGLSAVTAALNAIQSTRNSLSTTYSNTQLDGVVTVSRQLTKVKDAFDNLALSTILQANTNSVNTALDNLVNTNGIFDQLITVGSAFDKVGSISTSFLPTAQLLLNLARDQMVAYMQASLNELGSCSTSMTLVGKDNIPTQTIVGMLSQLQSHASSSSFPSSTTISANKALFTNALQTLDNYGTTVQPTMDTITNAFLPFSRHVAHTHDISTINYKISPTTGVERESNYVTFTSTLLNLSGDVAGVRASLLPRFQPIINRVPSIANNADDLIPHANAITAISNGSTSLHSTSHTTEEFPYSPFIAKSDPYRYTDTSTTPVTVGTRDQIYGHLQIYAEVRAQTYDDIVSTSSSISSRVEAIDTSINDMSTTINTWGDWRTTIKRSGYLVDQSRLIIIDVYISLGVVMLFCMGVFAIVKFHKLTMLCNTLLYPFVFLGFLLAAVHMLPTLLVSDGCDQRQDLLQIAIGNVVIPASFTQGLVSYLSPDPAQPINANDLFDYAYLCEEDKMPQVWQLLRDTTPSTIALGGDDLTTAQQKVDEVLGKYNRKPTPLLQTIVDHMTSISTDLAEVANNLYNTIECSQTQPVFQATIDKGICGGVAKSGALLGSFFFLASLCIFPGLFMGCSAFKVLNQRNHEKYRKKFVKQETDDGEVVFAHEYVQGSDHKGEIQHFKMNDPVALEDDVKYSDLKGFDGLKNHPTNKELEMSQF